MSEDSSHQSSNTPSRRQVLAGALGTGFALAVRPVSALTITTGTEGLDVADVRIPTRAGDVPAYRAMPARKKGAPAPKLPLVIVVHEIFGVHEHIRDVCRRLARQGYFAIAPDLFVRQGDVSKLADFDAIRAVVAKVPDAQVLVDLDATVEYAKATGDVDGSKLGITGFCWGGRVVWLYSAHSTALRAGVAWYGRLVGDQDALRPRQPVEIADLLNAPVLGLYGEKDKGIPLDTVEQMRRALAKGSPAARRSAIRVYPNAGHAFFADYRPSYDADAAKDAFARMLAFLRANGVG